MEFKKEIMEKGSWLDKETTLDNYAYYLYLKDKYKILPKWKLNGQDFFILFGDDFSDYYKEAIVILRKEKIMKLRLNINEF